MGALVLTCQNNLKHYLEAIKEGYGDKYTQSLWDNDVTSVTELAFASEGGLRQAGVLNGVHAGNINEAARSDHGNRFALKTYTWWAKGALRHAIASDVQVVASPPACRLQALPR